MKSAYKIADRIAMLHDGKIVFSGTPDETKEVEDPVVRRFIEGRWERPLDAELETSIQEGVVPAGGQDA